MAAESYFQLRNEAIRILKLQGKPYYNWSEKDKRDVDNFITKRLAKRTDSLSDPYSALYRKNDLDALEREKQIAKMQADEEAAQSIKNMWGNFGGGAGSPAQNQGEENTEENPDYQDPQDRVTTPFEGPGAETPTADTENEPSSDTAGDADGTGSKDETENSPEKKSSNSLAGKFGKGLGEEAGAGGLAEGVGTVAKGAEAIGEVGAIAEEGFVLIEFLPWIFGIILVFLIAALIIGLTFPEAVPAGTTNGGTDTIADASRPTNTADKGKGWRLKDGVNYSATQCAAGSKDLGLYTHPIRKFTIRKCQTKIGIVASIISQRALSMIEAAKADNITLRGSGFRSYEAQQGLYRQNCSALGCHPPTAHAGNSMHEEGLASDLWNSSGNKLKRSDEEFKWLSSNAAKFGYYNLASEPWHWSMSGN